MSDTVILSRKEELSIKNSTSEVVLKKKNNNLPSLESLETQLAESSKLVEDIILKKYLHKLDSLEVIPLPEELKRISDIRLFKITEMVYQKDEYSTYKFASVFSSVQNLNCGIFIIADSDGQKTDFYMGVRSLDDRRTTKSLKDTLRNALIGQFPGVKSVDLLDNQAEAFLSEIPCKNISSVSCVANNKDDDFKDNETFIQGLEKLALAMQGQRYTAIVLAKSTPIEQLDELRRAYEMIYTKLSPFANMQLSYGTNTALSISNALSHGTTIGTSYSKSTGTSKNTSYTKGYSASDSISKSDTLGALVKTAGSVALGALSVVTAPLTGGASLAAAGAILAGQVALGNYMPSTKSKAHSTSENYTDGESYSKNETIGQNESTSDTYTKTRGETIGTSKNMQLTMQNKNLLSTLERIDLQLKRLNECESLGMWECAAYFLSDSQETAEMAAGTYKALMKGSRSGIETSAINYWGRQSKEKTLLLKEYITNFIHPVFSYTSETVLLPVTASSLVSSNELAIQMGLPRKSVCVFPVIEHADFGKEVVSYRKRLHKKEISLGKIFSMGTETSTEVNLDINSLTMHTFITGSSGSGKSNTVYEMLRQLKTIGIGFMIIEPAKGEYKNVFGNNMDVTVLGTNPDYSKLLQINPFKFPKKTHILEHIDRLVEIFNVCWPMYAAMPAVLKDAVLQAYKVCGWDLIKSVNRYSNDLFPTFIDLQNELINVIENSAYSQEVKSNYMGSLLTRVKSLTNGLNGQIFSSREIDNKLLFDENVIVDLSRVGSLETKSLLMGILVMRLSEHRAAFTNGMNLPLKHITVLEEAHNILKRTSIEQNPESSNVAGKSVEMISNAIAEMRTYGEGFIIADQSPNAIDISAIRNTNTKIIMRLPDESDRKLAGKASALNDEQIDEIAKLPRGVAVVYQNDWIEPVLCKIKQYDGQEQMYIYHQDEEIAIDEKLYKTELFKLLLKGRTFEQLEPDIDLLKKQLPYVSISTKNKLNILYLLDEYLQTDKLNIWKDEKLDSLSKMIFELVDDNARTTNMIMTSRTFEEITFYLSREITEQTENLSSELILSVCQCLMKEFSKESDEKLTIYAAWRKEVVDKRGDFNE